MASSGGASGLVAVGTCVLVAQGASLGSSREVTACQSVGTGRNSRALGATPTTTTCYQTTLGATYVGASRPSSTWALGTRSASSSASST